MRLCSPLSGTGFSRKEKTLSRDPRNSADLIASIGDLPRHETERLLSKATDRPRTDLLLGVPITDTELATFEALAARRRAGEPLQYLEERIPFGPIEVTVDRRGLIPRPETEQLFALAVDAVVEPQIIVDLGTGSGNLALALKHAFPDAVVYATEISPAAASLARENSRDANLDVTVLDGDLFDPIPEHLRGNVDLIVSNPPYLSEAEIAELPADVRDHEPRIALVAGRTGDEVVAVIASEAPRWLAPGGTIVCEISEFRGPAMEELFAPLGGEVRKDLAGKDRFVIGRA
ncbi:MAG: peptide chain release factor N(5)-glutamine methyltransferase [Acidobacteria bacterium]|nr:peptide chain release factor N(5)-glutamine methyltransferase [Acidobacteriota bacterium]